MPWLQAPFLLPSSSRSHHPKCRRNPEGHGLPEHRVHYKGGTICLPDSILPGSYLVKCATSHETCALLSSTERQTPHFGAGISKRTLNEWRVHTWSPIPCFTQHFITLTVTKFSFWMRTHSSHPVISEMEETERRQTLHFNMLMSKSKDFKAGLLIIVTTLTMSSEWL